MKNTTWFAFLALVLSSMFSVQSTTVTAATHTLEWTKQLGTSGDDISFGVSSDGLGNVYISGFTGGSLGGPHAGYADAFLSKYDSDGNFQWTAQLGTSGDDQSFGVTSDGLGNVYISGTTEGSLGGTNAGLGDAFLSKYDSNGNFQWTSQLGTSSADGSNGVSSDGLGNAYISGYTRGSLDGTSSGSFDAFLSKYDSSGNLLWTEQLGTSSSDYSTGVSSDGLGNVYISGETLGSFGRTSAGGRDAFIVKFSDPVPEPSSLLQADFDQDGDVDGNDFLLLQRNDPSLIPQWQTEYGSQQEVNSLTSTQTVPEPTTLALALLAFTAFRTAEAMRFRKRQAEKGDATH